MAWLSLGNAHLSSMATIVVRLVNRSTCGSTKVDCAANVLEAPWPRAGLPRYFHRDPQTAFESLTDSIAALDSQPVRWLPRRNSRESTCCPIGCVKQQWRSGCLLWPQHHFHVQPVPYPGYA